MPFACPGEPGVERFATYPTRGAFWVSETDLVYGVLDDNLILLPESFAVALGADYRTLESVRTYGDDDFGYQREMFRLGHGCLPPPLGAKLIVSPDEHQLGAITAGVRSEALMTSPLWRGEGGG